MGLNATNLNYPSHIICTVLILPFAPRSERNLFRNTYWAVAPDSQPDIEMELRSR